MTASNNRPIVITMGDPSGVGPEVTAKALAALDARERRDYAVIGDDQDTHGPIRICLLPSLQVNMSIVNGENAWTAAASALLTV